jgi:hypothetical protein
VLAKFVPGSLAAVVVAAAAVVASFEAASGPYETEQSAVGLGLGEGQDAVAEKPWGAAGTVGAPLEAFLPKRRSVLVG